MNMVALSPSLHFASAGRGTWVWEKQSSQQQRLKLNYKTSALSLSWFLPPAPPHPQTPSGAHSLLLSNGHIPVHKLVNRNCSVCIVAWCLSSQARTDSGVLPSTKQQMTDSCAPSHNKILPEAFHIVELK